MPRREIHAPALIDNRRLQRLGQLDEAREPRGRASGAVGDNQRVLRVDEQPGGFGDRAGIALRRRRDREPRDAKARADLRRDRIFLQSPVDDHQHGHHGRVIAIL